MPEVAAAVRRRAGERRSVAGALIVDARSPRDHAAGHIPGSLSIPAGSSFGTWLGWVVDPDRPIVLARRGRRGPRRPRRARRCASGSTPFIGYIDGGIEAWRRGGRPVEAGAVLSVETLAARLAAGGPEAPFVIDVRQPSEYEAGHVPGSTHIGAGDLPEMLDRLPRDRPIATICASGYRSSVAASMLRAAGFEDVVDGLERRPDLGGARLPGGVRAGVRWRGPGGRGPARRGPRALAAPRAALSRRRSRRARAPRRRAGRRRGRSPARPPTRPGGCRRVRCDARPSAARR